VADRPIAAQLEELMQAEGAFFVDDKIKQILAKNLFVGHLPNPKAVGKSPQQLAQLYGFSVPDWARILVVRLNGVGRDEPLSGEKLTTVLGWYEADGWEPGCERCLELIDYGGRGHSLVIHARDENVIMQFGLLKPVFRIVVNTLGTLGTTGYTTGVMPSMTLGSGGVGGAITGDNITVHHMYNVKKLAYEIRTAPDAAFMPGSTDDPAQRRSFSGGAPSSPASVSSGSMDVQVEEIVRKVLLELKK
jgi:acetaldehyde dehydrogenase (acetylating)